MPHDPPFNARTHESCNDGFVELGFGDVVQFGNHDPATGEITWDDLSVVCGGRPPKDISAWPVTTTNDGEPQIVWTATTRGEFVRVHGSLIVDEVAMLLREGWSHMADAENTVSIYTQGQPEPRGRYSFILHA